MGKHFSKLKHQIMKLGDRKARQAVQRALTDHWEQEAERLEALASNFQAHFKCSPAEIELVSEIVENAPGVFRRTYRFKKISPQTVGFPDETI